MKGHREGAGETGSATKEICKVELKDYDLEDEDGDEDDGDNDDGDPRMVMRMMTRMARRL